MIDLLNTLGDTLRRVILRVFHERVINWVLHGTGVTSLIYADGSIKSPEAVAKWSRNKRPG